MADVKAQSEPSKKTVVEKRTLLLSVGVFLIAVSICQAEDADPTKQSWC